MTNDQLQDRINQIQMKLENSSNLPNRELESLTRQQAALRVQLAANNRDTLFNSREVRKQREAAIRAQQELRNKMKGG